MRPNNDINALHDAWSMIWAGFATPPPAGAFDAVVRQYRERKGYHTERHLSHVMSLWLENRALFRNPACAGLALFYHDAIYEPARSDNEARSADHADEIARLAGLDAKAIATIRFLILATGHNEVPAEPDAQLFVDIDLSILGVERGVYDAYTEGVRYEYRHVPGPLYRRGRAKVLEEFLSRERIFQ